MNICAMPTAADLEEGAPHLLALPHHLLVPLLQLAGGPSALQASRSTSTAWKAAIDSLVVKAACSTLPCSTAPLTSLPQLHTVDFSSCVEPMPPGRLAALLQELSGLPNLKTLHLSTWSMAEQQQEAHQYVASTAAPTPSAAAGAAAIAAQPASSAALTADMASSPAAVAAAAGPPQYDIILPSQIASITQLQELVISTCADVSAPAARRLALPASLMRMQHLTRLDLHGFLPPVHHLRGLKHLQHLAISVLHANADAAGDAAGVRVQQSIAAVKAVCAAVQAIPALTILQLQLSARQVGHPLEGASVVAGVDAGELLDLISTSTTPCTTHAAVAAAPAGAGAVTPAHQEDGRSSGSSRTPLATKLLQLRITYSGGLYHLPAKFAAACSALQELDLSYSRLTVEAAAVLGGLSCCTSLCLAESRLQEVPGSWAALTQLQVLDVSGNPLGALPPFLSRLQALNKLGLASTLLLALPGAISSLTNLQHLSVASNKLQELAAELCSCTGLVHLDVSKNRLLSLPEQFSALTRITQLSLTGNHLEALPSGLHGLRRLSHLGLALNYYKTWRHAVPCFAGLAQTLQELELQHTATVLTDSDGFLEVVGQLTALTSLAAGSNQMSDLPEAWRQLKRLKVLQLSHNAMESMPIALLSLPALTYLDLSYNRLMALPFWMGSSKLQQLKRLNLAKNHLTTLPAEMGRLSGLTQLQLQGNNLASVPPVLGSLHCLRVLNLGGNYKLKEGGLGQQLAGLGSLRDVVLPYRLDKAAEELRAAGKAVTLD